MVILPFACLDALGRVLSRCRYLNAKPRVSCLVLAALGNTDEEGSFLAIGTLLAGGCAESHLWQTVNGNHDASEWPVIIYITQPCRPCLSPGNDLLAGVATKTRYSVLLASLALLQA